MRISAFAGLFACALIVAVNSSTVSAEAFDLLQTKEPLPEPLKVSVLRLNESAPAEEAPVAAVPAPKPEPKIHEVVASETLTTIAEKYQTTWVRLFNKNEQIANPDIIAVGDKITVPLPEEELKDRPLPTPAVIIAVTPPAPLTRSAQPRAVAQAPTAVSRGASSGNTYSPGYCTWYAKNRRPDLPNNLGNANTWVARAAAQGIPTGSAPRAGAIGQQGMHVVYIESVNGDGTVTVSEMNYNGFNVVSSRTVPASTFQYIY